MKTSKSSIVPSTQNRKSPGARVWHFRSLLGILFLSGTLMLIGAWTAQAATLTVTNTADSGPGSFRQAILDADADTSTNDVSIEFNIPGSGVQTIAPLTPLPAITRAVTRDGYLQ